jgi:hypothetical protein
MGPPGRANSDLPCFNPHKAVSALLPARVSDDDRHNIRNRNAERLLIPFIDKLTLQEAQSE